MRVEQIELKNCLCFAKLTLSLPRDQNITVIMGQQGSGKTALLKQIYHALTWFCTRYKDARSAGVVMPDADIRLGQRQSKISLNMRINADIASLPESAHVEKQDKDCQLVTWHLYKTLNQNGVGISQADTAELEQFILRLQKAQQQDPLLATPLVAFYPVDRFISEINLLSKNNPAVLQAHAAYDLVALPYTNFARFFEWLREVTDAENAQQALFIQGIKPQPSASTDTPPQDHLDWSARFEQARKQLQQRCLHQLNGLIHQMLPEVELLFIQYTPKLDLMVRRCGVDYSFAQLPNSLKVAIALIGDIFRRACLLLPHSAVPQQDIEGMVIIDQIDLQLDAAHCSDFLLRLGQCFPGLQFVVSGQRQELLEHGEHWQCLALNDYQLHPLNLAQSQNQWQQLYHDLAREDTAQTADLDSIADIAQPLLAADAVGGLWQQIQQLSAQQQQALKQLWHNDAMPNSQWRDS